MKKLFFLIMVIVALTGFGAAKTKGSCRAPLPWQIGHCREMEQTILAATVRIAFHGHLDIENGYEVQRVQSTISHATVVDGRYLITHNHFGIPLSQVQIYNQYANGGLTGVSLYRLDGTSLLDHAPLDVFSVVSERGETVLLDFGSVKGQGFFAHAGVTSAPLAGSEGARPVPGAEVAQIDWDRQGHTRVVWANIERISNDDDLPHIIVDHFIEHGASGGGVFFEGRHIGNNWGRIVSANKTAAGHESIIALNNSLMIH